MWGEGLVENVIYGERDWLKTSEYRHRGEGILNYLKNRHMIFERSLNTIVYLPLMIGLKSNTDKQNNSKSHIS